MLPNSNTTFQAKYNETTELPATGNATDREKVGNDDDDEPEIAEESIDYSNEVEVDADSHNTTNCPKVLIGNSTKTPEVKTLEVVIPSVRRSNVRSEPLLIYQWKLLKNNISQQLEEIENFIASRKSNMTAQPTRFAAIMLQQHFQLLTEVDVNHQNITEGSKTFDEYRLERDKLAELLLTLNSTKTIEGLRDRMEQISSQLARMVRLLVTKLSDVSIPSREARLYTEQVMRVLRKMLLEIINNIRSSSGSEMSIGDNSDILDWEILLGRSRGHSRRFFFSRVFRTETLPATSSTLDASSTRIENLRNDISENTTPFAHV